MRILFLGYEKRYEVLIKSLKEKNDIYVIGYDIKDQVKKGDLSNLDFYDIIVLPMRGVNNLIVDGKNINGNIFENYKGKVYTGVKKDIKGNVESFLEDEEIVLENTLISVEGILDKISDLKKDNICILGYGKIGSMLYKKLKDKNIVFIGVKKEDDLKLDNSFLTTDIKQIEKVFKKCDLIINTVPNHIIEDKILKKYNKVFLDIASYPYGVDQDKVSKYPFYYQQYLSIPSKYAPERAGKILLKKF